MPPKSERFEMRLDSTMMNRIDQWSAENGGTSRAEAARLLILHGLDRSSRYGVQLSDGEKLIVAMLADLEKPRDHREIDSAQVMEAIYGGHYWSLKWELTGLFHDHIDDPGAVSLVVDTLDMWCFIEEAVENFSPAERKRIEKEAGPLGKDPRFQGFDGNYEGTYLGIAHHLVEKMDRFQRFKGRGLNSHCPMISRYARMARLFQPIRANLGMRQLIRLTADEVISLFE